MQRARAFFAPVAVIGLAHVVGGIAALVAPGAAHVSGLAGAVMLGSQSEFTGFMLIIVGTMAILSRLCPGEPDTVTALVIPQQLVLMIQLGGVIAVTYNGAYADGYRPAPDYWGSVWFILADQAPLIAMCFSHTFELAFGGLVNEEREFYQNELKYAQEKLARCQRCWDMQNETAFWEEMSRGKGPNNA